MENPKEAKFTELAGVPVHYDRGSGSTGYGTRGTSYCFYCTNKFLLSLQNCFAELWAVCPFGKAEVICLGGTYVNKPKMHGQGRAVDIDAIFWGNKDFITTNYQNDPKLYTAIETVIRKYFGTVLNYNYNVAHNDHWHCDDGTEVRFSKFSESRVWYLQAALTYIHNKPVALDGVWGPETKLATDHILNYLGINGPIEDLQIWLNFLTATAISGFK